MKTWWVVDEDLDDDRERVHLNAISRDVIPPCEIIAVVKLADVEALEKIAQAIDDENAALERRVKWLESHLISIRDRTLVDADGPELRAQNECNLRRAIEGLAAEPRKEQP